MEDAWTEVNASWKGDSTFVGMNAAGGTVQMGVLDGKPGINPMQLLLAAVAGCTGIDIVSILQKKRIKLTDMQVRVRGKRAPEFPKNWSDIHISYLIWGEEIKSKDVEQAILMSEEKYCSVGLMIRKASQITSDYQILEPGQSPN